MPKAESIRSKVTAGVITGVVLMGVTYVGREWLPPTWRGIVWLADTLWTWLSSGHSIPGWLLLIFAVCTVTFVFTLAVTSLGTERALGPHWHDYRSDQFFNIVWRWDYRGGQIGQPVPYCCNCDTQIVAQEDYDYGSFGRALITQLKCDYCGGTNEKFSEPFQNLLSKVVRQVDRKLRTEEWKQTRPPATLTSQR